MNQFAMNSAKSDGTTDLAERGGAVGETIMANHETKTPRVMGVGRCRVPRVQCDPLP